jgi:hypothetical protein
MKFARQGINLNEIVKGKVKFRGGALQHYSHIGLLYSDPKGVPSFISRGAAHQAA